MDSYSFNDVLMLSKLLKCISFFPLTLSLEPYCIPLQQFWDQTTANLHWEFEEHNMTIHHCEDWQNDYFCGWGPDVLWTRYRCENSVHHRLVLSSLSKTGTSNIETLHSLPFKTDITYCFCGLNVFFIKYNYSGCNKKYYFTISTHLQFYNIYKSDCHWEQFQNMCLNVCLN